MSVDVILTHVTCRVKTRPRTRASTTSTLISLMPMTMHTNQASLQVIYHRSELISVKKPIEDVLILG